MCPDRGSGVGCNHGARRTFRHAHGALHMQGVRRRDQGESAAGSGGKLPAGRSDPVGDRFPQGNPVGRNGLVLPVEIADGNVADQ
ncbi:hypothetical protein SDC9_127365 [bioreactor metagenome]|uniref:Uncharacterized protein n=1 Tax=bioreactor metagenome TaxID=1076179 RepID=A0A645CTW6_9ZZZZ